VARPATTTAPAAAQAPQPTSRAERRAERARLAAQGKAEQAAKNVAVVRPKEVAPMEPDSEEAREARRAMAQILAGRGKSVKKSSAALVAAARAAAQDERGTRSKHGAQGRQETGAQRAEGEYRRALANLQDGRMTETIAALEQALKYEPAHEAARQTLVGLLIEANRTDEAVRQLQLGLTLDARQPAMAMLLARLQIERGGSGIDTLLRTLPYAGNDPDYRAFLAGALARQQRHREAAEQYQQAVRANPGNGVWWMGLGISLQADKRNGEALDAFQKARASGGLAPELQSFVERRIQQLGR
jgi:MSHA biogenesis protein MshN